MRGNPKAGAGPVFVRKTGLPAVVLLAVALARPAAAAIEGSPHDLIAQGYDVVKTSAGVDRCGRCHVPSATGTEGFLPAVPESLAAWSRSSLTCFSCHDGTTLVSPEVDASLTAFHPGGHIGKLVAARTDAGGDAGDAPDLPAGADGRIECATCHDTHNNGRRPLLRVELTKLCLRCHADRVETGRGKENRTGNHLLTVGAVTPAPESPIKVGPGFRTPFPSPYPLQGAKAAPGVHWDLGGHLSEGGDGVIGCETCHAVHGNEDAPPLPAQLSVDPVRAVADLFCEGCHEGVRGDAGRSDTKPNPGGTTTGRTYHPGDDDLSNKAGRIVETKDPAGWPMGSGSPRQVLCSTCHRAHGAMPGVMLLRKPTGTSFCGECHEIVPDYHHPGPQTWVGPCVERVPAPKFDDPALGSCGYCHRAHNAGLDSGAELEFVPLLRERLSSLDGCLQCHPDGNPTCGKRPEFLASHFIGDPTLPETYLSTNPPLRTVVWPESQLPSVYAGERSQVVTCRSCHVFRKGAVTSGDKGTVRNLLAQSGNPVEWEQDEGVYLCTGCHTATPGTGTEKKGHTHPTMIADITKLGKAGPQDPMSATVNGRVNCDSCHRPHEAATGSGYYILERITSENPDARAIHPKIDYTVVCHGCHEPGKY